MKKIPLLFAAAALGAVALQGPAQAVTTVVIHPGGFDSSLRDVRSSGHEAFLDDGLSVYTDDNSSQAKVAEYIDVAGQNLPDSLQLSWSGSDPEPGSQLVFDFDQTNGNENDYNILVGEKVYNDPDGTPTFWLTNGSSADAHLVCPRTTGGSGSACWGTLSQWKAAIPNADVKAVGFSLGSGIKGAGVLHSITMDSTQFRFSDTTNPPEAVNVTGSYRVVKKTFTHARKVAVHFNTNQLGANQVPAKFLTWKVASDGKRVFKSVMGPGSSTAMHVRYAKHTGKHETDVYKNGALVKVITTRTGH